MPPRRRCFLLLFAVAFALPLRCAGGHPYLPAVSAVDLDVYVNQNNDAAIELISATRIPDGERAGQLVWPITVPATSAIVHTLRVHVRKLYHEHMGDIRMRLLHGRLSAMLVNQRGDDRDFGEPRARDYWDLSDWKMARNLEAPLEGTGFDYTFADVIGASQAIGRHAEQSSTMAQGTEAHRAVDADLYYSGMATHSEVNPWLQIDLGSELPIGTVALWAPDPGRRLYEIQVVRATGIVTLAGSFKLRLSHNGATLTTDAIAYNAVPSISDEAAESDLPGAGLGESMQAKLQALDNIGAVAVQRSVPDRVGGYSWTVTFVSETANVDELQLASNDLSAGRLRLDSDQQATVSVETRLNGTMNTYYNSEMEFISVLVSSVPFGHTDLAGARAVASLERSTVYDDTNRVMTVPFPLGTVGRYVRVTLKQESYLALAEVQVFAEQTFNLKVYDGGSPVPTGGYTPETALGDTFKGSGAEGDWFLVVDDLVAQSVLNEGVSHRRVQAHGTGSFSDWVLELTHEDADGNSGLTTLHYVDMSANVVTLPTYGKLYIADAYERGQLIEAVVGQEIFTSPCYVNCSHKWGSGNWLSTSSKGSLARENRLRSDRRVVYVPNQDFLGEDYFDYRLTQGTYVDPTVATVKLHVRQCRGNHPGCENDQLFGRLPTMDEELRSDWQVSWDYSQAMEHPFDKWGEDGIFWEFAYCDNPPCNSIP